MSERVRMAMALDSVEEYVMMAGRDAVEHAESALHVQNELTYTFGMSIDYMARVYGVDASELRKQAMRMLHDEIRRALCGVCDVRYVKPYVVDGEEAGITAKFYKFDRRTA